MFNRSRRVIGIPGSRIWTKTLMGLIFNPYGVFRWSPEGPVSQIHSPHLHAGAPGILSDLLRSVHTLKREGVAENNRKLQHLFIPSKTATWVFFGRPAFGQNRNLGVCSERSALGQNTLIMISINNFSSFFRSYKLYILWLEISGSLIWSKTLMELIFNPYGVFRWSPEGPISQIHSPHLLVGAPGIFSELLRFV